MKTRQRSGLIGILTLAALVLFFWAVRPAVSVQAQNCTTYTTQDFCDGWIYLGVEPGVVECVDENTLLVSRCNHNLKELPAPLFGLVEFTASVLPKGDYDTNFSIRLGSTTSSMDAVFLGMNETNRWVYHDENGGEHWIGPYSGTWTQVRILMDTATNTWSLWLDGALIAEDIIADWDITAGINLFQLHSGRSTIPKDSYLRDIELDNCTGVPAGTPPALDPIPDQTAMEGDPFSLSLADYMTETDGDEVYLYSFPGTCRPAWASIPRPVWSLVRWGRTRKETILSPPQPKTRTALPTPWTLSSMSKAGGNIFIDNCDTGVEDRYYNGQWISEMIEACAAGAANHGAFVSCVAALTNDLKKARVISGQEKGAIQSCAAQADIP